MEQLAPFLYQQEEQPDIEESVFSPFDLVE